jgi:hypothetical protein
MASRLEAMGYRVGKSNGVSTAYGLEVQDDVGRIAPGSSLSSLASPQMSDGEAAMDWTTLRKQACVVLRRRLGARPAPARVILATGLRLVGRRDWRAVLQTKARP